MTVETRELVPTREESSEESEGFAKTIQFIETALAQGAHFRVPEGFSKEEQWDRNVDITLVYLLSPDETLDDTGRIYGGITRERVSQIRDRTMKNLWTNCSTETQAIFPFEKLELNKPRPQKTVELRPSHQKNEELLERLKSASTDKEKETVLNQIPYGLYVQLQLTKGDDPLLMRVKKAIAKAGYHVRTPQDPSLFYEVIKTEGIPMASIQRETKVGSKKIVMTYHAILTEDEERAKNAWSKREDLQKFLISPVQQVAGPEQQGIPPFSLIEQRNRFRKVGALLLEFGIPLGRPTKKYRTVLLAIPDCPVPIYRYDRSYLYPVAGEGELRTFVNKHLLTNSQGFAKLPIS